MCDIALVYSQWLCFNLLRRTDVSDSYDLSGLFTEEDNSISSN